MMLSCNRFAFVPHLCSECKRYIWLESYRKADVWKNFINRSIKMSDLQIQKESRGKEILNKAYQQGWLSGFDFSLLIQDMTISENGYVIDTGSWENVNAEVALQLAKRIKKHPIIWKIFFMVA